MGKEKVAILYGGRSAEHEISIITALQAMKAIDTRFYEIVPIYLSLNGKWYTGEPLLDRQFYKKSHFPQELEVTLLPDPSVGGFVKLLNHETIPIDICFLAFHGQYGEDGCVQGLLELADLPYTGSGVLSSAVTMNKHLTKILLQAQGISVLPSVVVKKAEVVQDLQAARQKVLDQLSFPMFVKPNHLGSSIGISVATDAPSLNAALAKVFQYDSCALVEPQIKNLMEVNVAVLDGDTPMASVIEIPVASEGVLSYEDKYLRGGSKSCGGMSSGMAGLTRVIDPSDLDASIKKQLIGDALKAFELLDCSGVCRLDFNLDLDYGTLYFNEINPIPGSFAYYLWDKMDPPILYTELIHRMLKKGKERKALQRSLKQDLGFTAL